MSSVESRCKPADEPNAAGLRKEVTRWKWSAPTSAVRTVAAAFFPLDHELQVPEGHLLPPAQETLVSLRSELPFGRVVKHLKRTLGVVVPVSTVRRQTLALGQRMLDVQNEQAQPLADCPQEKAAERLAMSSDGSMVPRVGRRVGRGQGGGHWAS